MQRRPFTLENDAFVNGVPHDTFSRLRREAPVAWYDWEEGKGFWCITKHADIAAMLKDWRSFSSEAGGANLEDLDAEQLERRKSMLETDPPRHTRLRALVGKWFTPKAVGQYEDMVRGLARDIVEAAFAMPAFDFVEAISARLPIQVLAKIMGVPEVETPRLVTWGDRMIGNTDPDLTDILWESEDAEKFRMYPFRSPAALEVFEYGHFLAKQRREKPEDDLVSRLVHAEIDGMHLTEQEFDTMFLLLVVAGNETTRQAITHGAWALMEHPDQLEMLQEEPERMSVAVEEILRWASPILHFRRTATRDVTVRGQQISAGDKVVFWFVSANRDEEVFSDPFRFDVMRDPNDHMAFGKGGPHTCLGAYLARLELRVLFEEAAPYLSRIEIAGQPRYLRSNFTHGIKSLPVRRRV